MSAFGSDVWSSESVYENSPARSEYQIGDIGMRMLTPRELFAAQGFPADYDLLGGRLSQKEQVRLAGNSVCPPVAAALVRAQLGIQAVAA